MLVTTVKKWIILTLTDRILKINFSSHFSNYRLQIFCKHNLERNVHVGNVIKILDAADKTGTTQMKRYSLDMCVKHFDKVASQPNLKTLSKDLLLDIMGAVAIDWPNANK